MVEEGVAVCDLELGIVSSVLGADSLLNIATLLLDLRLQTLTYNDVVLEVD